MTMNDMYDQNVEEVIDSPKFSEEELIENRKWMKKSRAKSRVFLLFSTIIVLSLFLFFSQPLFIFNPSNSTEDMTSTVILFNMFSYVFLAITFVYMIYYLVYLHKRESLPEDEQMETFENFKKKYNAFDLLGVIPVFLAFLTIINGLWFGFATVVGPSMEPTFCSGDYVVIDHYTNDFVKEDIMIFVVADGTKLIKRVIAVPGDTLLVDATGVYVNGELQETYFHTVTHYIYDGVLPDGAYFVMGDNRTNSNDSRSFGLVHQSDILGEVVFQVSPTTCEIGS